MSHSIKLQRLYKVGDWAHRGEFVVAAEPLPADVSGRMTDAEHIARRQAERKAIAAASGAK